MMTAECRMVATNCRAPPVLADLLRGAFLRVRRGAAGIHGVRFPPGTQRPLGRRLMTVIPRREEPSNASPVRLSRADLNQAGDQDPDGFILPMAFSTLATFS